MKKEYDRFKKDQENSPISLVKTELKDKLLEIKELKKEQQKSNEIRDQYKVYYEKMRCDYLKLKSTYEMFKEEVHFKNHGEIESLRNEIQIMRETRELDLKEKH